MPPFWHGIELVELVDGEHEIAFGNLQPRFELAGIREVVHVDLRRAGDRLDGLGLVVHVVPAGRIVQPADHVDAVGREHVSGRRRDRAVRARTS